jgi:hypothetical protein
LHLVVLEVIVGFVREDARRVGGGTSFVGETREVIRMNEDSLKVDRDLGRKGSKNGVHVVA